MTSFAVAHALPDETTILNFRHLLEKHELTALLREAINMHLKAQGMLVSKGTMVDTTLIHAPGSTKNQRSCRLLEGGSSLKTSPTADDEAE